MQEMGRWLMVLGVVLLVVGAVIYFGGRLGWFGRLPGDVVIQRGNVTFFFPIVTMIVVSLVLTVLLNLIARFWR